jgi:hypothetical protein
MAEERLWRTSFSPFVLDYFPILDMVTVTVLETSLPEENK